MPTLHPVTDRPTVKRVTDLVSGDVMTFWHGDVWRIHTVHTIIMHGETSVEVIYTDNFRVWYNDRCRVVVQ